MHSMQLYIALATVCSASAFHTPSRLHPTPTHIGDRKGVLIASPLSTYNANSYRRDVSMGLFRDLLRKVKDRGGNGGDDDEQESKDEGDEQLLSSTAAVVEEEEKLATPFFASDFLETRARDSTTESSEEVNVVEASDVPTEPQVQLPPPTPPQPPVVEVKTPAQAAEELRAQAGRIRLEAEKRTVELTLEKIDKLNSQLELMKKKENDDPKSQKSLEEELLRLKSQLITNEKGEIKPVAPPAPAVTKVSTPVVADDSSVQSQPITVSKSTLSSEALEERVQKFNEAPEFMRILVAKIAGYGVDDNTPGAVNRLNATDIVLKLYDDNIGYEDILRKSDFTDESEREEARRMLERAYEQSGDDGNKLDKPKFTKEQIQEKVEELDQIPTFLKNIYSKEFNDTEMALMLLEEEYENKNKKGGFFGMFGDNQKGDIGRDGERMDVENPGAFSRLFSPEDALNGTSAGKKGGDLSFMIESLYPKSTRKEDETPDKRLVDAFMNDVVASTNSFIPSSNPISVPGGYIVRGTNKCSSGGELIDKLDKRVANDARLREKISFFVLKDPFPDIEDGIIDPFNWPQVLFIAGPNVAREPEVILRTLITSLGIATTWYGSIYPFLSNSKLLDKANEAMDLSDAGMPVDMSWLSDMSIPLFLTFIALQLVHEVAHLAVANSKKFEISVPTLVPSILSGITSSITTLKSSPKNKQDLLEFAVAGPLAGMICSILVLSYGLGLTATADAATIANFPGLPLAVLRQSSLGGGLVDIFLGNGVLNVPASAEGAQLLASTMIALHPFAIAGFLSLFVNALAMVPVGRTDGGRVAMAIFGRSGSQGVTFFSLLLMFVLGFSGESDLLLFYFGFVVFAQSELEIPMRNEIDDVDFSRVFVAGVALFLTILTLIPMQ